MTRKDARASALQLLYQYEFHRDLKPEDYLARAARDFEGSFNDYTLRLFHGVLEHTEALDALITAHSKNWRLDRINRVSRCILRIALFEMRFDDKVDTPIAINEAVELSKEFELGESSAFINGVLGGVAREEQS